MKRHSSDIKYKILRMLDNFAKAEGLSIKDETASVKFIDRLSVAVREQRSDPIHIHGFRIESMFAHVVAALGGSQIITEEDSGAIFSSDEDVRRPDFRIVTNEGEQLLVEVKNFRQKDPMDPFILKSKYLLGLRKYANVFKVSLKLAIYWSLWRMWTLVDAKHFTKNHNYSITLPEALKRSEMNILGDHMVATVPPLSLRLYADPNKPRRVEEDGQVHFTIGRAALLTNGKEISDDFERKLAWFFMLHGKWNEVDQPAEIVDGLLEYTEFRVSPEQYDKSQEFAILGFLSELISSNYNFLTSSKGEIMQLEPKQQPDDLCVLIPKDYKGKVLRLWRFHVQPNFEELPAT